MFIIRGPEITVELSLVHSKATAEQWDLDLMLRLKPNLTLSLIVKNATFES
jgi:hypothetical protein